eukprot:CCRYP_016686-RA/>CCRYP_016686-RA protein AED:0.28 eAED:0.28 QI:0/0.66/0.5/1/0/0/4/1240/60
MPSQRKAAMSRLMDREVVKRPCGRYCKSRFPPAESDLNLEYDHTDDYNLKTTVRQYAIMR